MLQPETPTVEKLFSNRVQFEIPLYQRAYAWREDENWAPLWQDVAETVNATRRIRTVVTGLDTSSARSCFTNRRTRSAGSSAASSSTGSSVSRRYRSSLPLPAPSQWRTGAGMSPRISLGC